MIIANPAHTIPRILAEKLLGAPADTQTVRQMSSWAAEDLISSEVTLTFSYPRIQQYSPRKPHGRGQGEGIFFFFFTVDFKPSKWAADTETQKHTNAHTNTDTPTQILV